MTQKYHIIKALDKGSFGEVSLAKLHPSTLTDSTNPALGPSGTASISTATASKKGMH